MFIDAHCHLDMLKDTDKIIERARKGGVGIILANGVNPQTNKKVLELAKQYESVKAVLGIYPIEALNSDNNEIDKEIKFIEKNKDHVFGIGEVGMDFKEDDERERQEEIFVKFIKLAKKLDVPITVHSRKAEKECIDVLEKNNAKKVIMHYFSGKLSLLDRITNAGWFLSVPTCVKNSEHFQKLIVKTDIDNLLCETDSPYSHPDKKFPNEPLNVITSYEMIAKLKGLSVKEVEKRIEENFEKLTE